MGLKKLEDMLDRVAVIGAGPGGLVASKFLKGQGFSPTLFEAHSSVGGQWDNTNPMSGVWPLMRTNTARMVTRFSDLDHGDGIAIFPRNTEIADYLRSYAAKFGLDENTQTGTRLQRLDRNPNGWTLRLEANGQVREEIYPRVVIATGAYNRPAIPAVPGLDTFSGDAKAIHAFHYKNPEAYRGKRVLIAGGNISSLEIASDLAMLGAASVSTAMRRQRYVMPKLIAGTPVESYGFTRAGAIYQETASSEDWAAATKAFVLQYGGNPAWYGAPEPDADIRVAGTTGSQNFLNLVAENRVSCFPWITGIEGRNVAFDDGRTAEFDGIVFGTGYDLNLPFLSDELRETLEVDRKGITLAERTFHPQTPGLAFMGLFGQIGPYLPVLELQARFLAYSWGGAIPAMDQTALESACETSRNSRGKDAYQHLQCLNFGRLAGADPEGRVDPELAQILADNAVTAISFRLVGPEALPDAEAQIRNDARRFGRKHIGGQ